MSIGLHSLAPSRGAKKASFRVGRGNASGRGTTAGRGTKGQRARSGGRNKLKMRGMRHLILSMPKLRGFKSLQPKAASVTLERLDGAFASGARVDLKVLQGKGLAPVYATHAKIVGTGPITKAIHLGAGIKCSEGAAALITKAGGTITATKKPRSKKTSPKK